MSGEKNLDKLLKAMSPVLLNDPYVFLTQKDKFTDREFAESVMIFNEVEGTTLIIKETTAKEMGKKYQNLWAMITLQVHSDLNAVGFLAAITQKLAQIDISVNAVSAFYHDHLFVPWEKREEAMAALKSYSS